MVFDQAKDTTCKTGMINCKQAEPLPTNSKTLATTSPMARLLVRSVPAGAVELRSGSRVQRGARVGVGVHRGPCVPVAGVPGRTAAGAA